MFIDTIRKATELSGTAFGLGVRSCGEHILLYRYIRERHHKGHSERWKLKTEKAT